MARILLIDDDSQVLDMLQKALQRAGYDVIATSRALDAMPLYKKEPADLLITDILMPEQEGLETIREFRREVPDLKIIAISGAGSGGSLDYLQTAKLLGADRTLAKPFARKEMLEAVGELLEN